MIFISIFLGVPVASLRKLFQRPFPSKAHDVLRHFQITVLLCFTGQSFPEFSCIINKIID